jgi:hypothetical protein
MFIRSSWLSTDAKTSPTDRKEFNGANPAAAAR